MVLLKILNSGESSIVFIPGDKSSTMGKNIFPDSNQDFEKLLRFSRLSENKYGAHRFLL